MATPRKTSSTTKAKSTEMTPKAPAKSRPAPAARRSGAAAKAAPAVKSAAKADKPKKPKLLRDSFTIPKAEYTVLDELKQRAAKLGNTAKKSELLRAGIKALAAMEEAAFAAALASVPAIKTGRPKKA